MPGVDTKTKSDHRPQRPAVVPRAGRPESDARVPLDQLIRPLLDTGPGLICITAPLGGGKTCALNYLFHVFGDAPSIQFFDADSIDAATQAAKRSIAILATHDIDPAWAPLAVFALKPWTLDDCIEYLAYQHRERLTDVMEQLTKDAMVPALHGSPELLALVMDELVTAPVVLSIGRGMRLRVLSLQVPQGVRDSLIGERRRIENGKAGEGWRCVDVGDLPGWFRHEVPQRCWVGEEMADRLSRCDFYSSCMKDMKGRVFIDDIAAAVSRNHDARHSLEAFVASQPRHTVIPMAASILLRVDPEWRPPSRRKLNLHGAVLRNARWKGIDLLRMILIKADCSGADFTDANLSKVQARDAIMNRVRLCGTNLYSADMARVQLQNADLSMAQAEQIDLEGADLSGARLIHAKLTSAHMDGAVLTGANLSHAILETAVMERAVVDGANFTDADLTGARLKAVNMSDATWNGVSFYNAIIRSCNLEGLEIARANFRKADLTRSLLTGSRMIGGDFEGASLASAGLAEIDWIGANLRYANLTEASFHLGSSRSGMVGSTIPCEGSRTGFYTDEYNEQSYKSAEEIRKACLCGVDLTGATLDRTDFYLVDLRRARYTVDQRLHFQRCGAILVSRVA